MKFDFSMKFESENQSYIPDNNLNPNSMRIARIAIKMAVLTNFFIIDSTIDMISSTNTILAATGNESMKPRNSVMV